MENYKSLKKYIEYFMYAFLVILIVFALSRVYEILLISPDDVAYANILSGITTGEPSPYCWFIRYPLTFLLSQIYSVFPGIEWYQVFLLCCHMLCYFLIYCRGRNFAGRKKAAYILGASAVIFLLCIEYTIHLEWTSTAGILGGTAVFRYVSMKIKEPITTQIKEYAICFVLLIVGFCLRNQVIMMFIPLAFICWVKRCYDIYQMYKNDVIELKYKEIANVAFIALAGVSVLLVMISHSLGYSDDEWTAYSKYTISRSVLFDYYGYPEYETYKEVYESAGISQEMYNLMVSDYNYVIPFDQAEKIDLESIANLARVINGNKTVYDECLYIQEKIENLLCDDRFLIAEMMLVICIISLIIKMGKSSSVEIGYYVAAIVWVIAMFIYLASKGRLPIRVGLAIVLGLCAIVFGDSYEKALLGDDTDENVDIFQGCIKNSFCKVFSALLLCGLITVNMFDVYTDNQRGALLATAKNQILQYCAQNPDALYLRDFGSFSQRGNLFYGNVRTFNYISTGGWTYNTPVYEEILENNGIDTIVDSVKNGKQVYYLVSEGRYRKVSNRLNDYFKSMGENIVVRESTRFYTIEDTVIVLEFANEDAS